MLPRCLLSLGLISGLLDVRSAVLCVAYDGESAADVRALRAQKLQFLPDTSSDHRTRMLLLSEVDLVRPPSQTQGS